jgi:3-oxoacyl-(acyl-carrier-protein) synthase
MDRFIQYAIATAEQAMRQSALKIDHDNAESVGVLMGNGIGDERIFMRRVDAAISRISSLPSKIVLLGIPADRPESDYRGSSLPSS